MLLSSDILFECPLSMFSSPLCLSATLAATQAAHKHDRLQNIDHVDLLPFKKVYCHHKSCSYFINMVNVLNKLDIIFYACIYHVYSRVLIALVVDRYHVYKMSVFFSWTDVDANVTCRQLGFNGGEFSFLSWAMNDTTYMLYYKPQCEGTEDRVVECPGYRGIQIGSKICGEHIHTYSLQGSPLH